MHVSGGGEFLFKEGTIYPRGPSLHGNANSSLGSPYTQTNGVPVHVHG